MDSKLTIEKLYKIYKPQLSNYVKYRLKFKSRLIDLDTEEIVNDVFIKANRYLHTYDGSKSNILTWLYIITNTTIIDWQRTAMKKQDHSYDTFNDYKLDFIDERNPDTSFLYDSNLIKNKMDKTISNLKEMNRDIANLYFHSNFKLNDIATELNIPLGTVKGTLHRISKTMKTEMAEFL